jgi:hypothetical protein
MAMPQVPMMPNPQFQQWQQLQQQIQAITKANQMAQQKFDAAVALIKKDGVHGFRIDIEADSTIEPDVEAEQEQRVGFIKEFVPFIEQIIPMCMGNPSFCDFAEKLVLFAMRPFKVARMLEESVTALFEDMKGMPPVPPKGAQQGKSGADSPQDLAVRANDTQARLRIAQGNNTVQMAKIHSEEQLEGAKLALQAKEHHDTLAEGINREADQRAFRDVRTGAIEAREAERLT